MNLSSKLIETAVGEIAKLPGIGKKSALRMVLYLLKEPEEATVSLSQALLKLRKEVKYCKCCHNISDEDLCSICLNQHRDKSVICIVEDIPDIIAIENTNHYQGLYHVLGGVISPIDGIGPADLNIQSLLNRITAETHVKEVIVALSATMQGDTTAFYIARKIRENTPNITISGISRGIAVGSELEYTDEITLGRSIANRIKMD